MHYDRCESRIGQWNQSHYQVFSINNVTYIDRALQYGPKFYNESDDVLIELIGIDWAK